MSQTIPPEQSHVSSNVPEHDRETIQRATPARTAPKKRGVFAWMTPRVRVTLGIIVIALAVIGAFLGPKEGNDSDNVTGDPASTPTVIVSNPLGSTSFTHSLTVQSVHLTFTQANEATKFSDDRQRGGSYIVRVSVSAENTMSSPVGIYYDKLIRLVLPDGQSIAPKYISVLPNMLPKQTQVGVIDFPLASPVPLNQLMMHVGNETIPLS